MKHTTKFHDESLHLFDFPDLFLLIHLLAKNTKIYTVFGKQSAVSTKVTGMQRERTRNHDFLVETSRSRSPDRLRLVSISILSLYVEYEQIFVTYVSKHLSGCFLPLIESWTKKHLLCWICSTHVNNRLPVPFSSFPSRILKMVMIYEQSNVPTLSQNVKHGKLNIQSH